jgi:hypothetical protein
MIEKSGLRQQERTDTGSGDRSAFGMPLPQLHLALNDISSFESRDQLLRPPGIQRRHDHPVRLQIWRYGLHGYRQSLSGPDPSPHAYDRHIETGCPAQL